jgi:DNA-binding response OmpR family regulator
MKKILLVDSEESILTEQESFLSRANMKIFTASSGRKAIEIHKKEQPDAVVIEFDLPDMTGLELYREISTTKSSPILMVMEKGDDEIIKACKYAGIYDFIFKPFDQKDLLKRIGNLLNIPQRGDFRILMKIRVEGNKEGSFFMGNTIDISTTGVLIESHHEDINVGDHLECNFFLPWKLKAVNISGEVMRKVKGKEGFHYGIRFHKLDPILRKEIEDYIKKKERISGP